MILADLVVASAGDDKKISLWRKNGQSMGTIPVAGTDSGDNIDVSIWPMQIYCGSYSRKCCGYSCSRISLDDYFNLSLGFGVVEVHVFIDKSID